MKISLVEDEKHGQEMKKRKRPKLRASMIGTTIEEDEELNFSYNKPRWITYHLKRDYELNSADVDIFSYIYALCARYKTPVQQCAKTMSDNTGNSENTVRAAIKRLMDKGLLDNDMSGEFRKSYSLTVNKEKTTPYTDYFEWYFHIPENDESDDISECEFL